MSLRNVNSYVSFLMFHYSRYISFPRVDQLIMPDVEVLSLIPSNILPAECKDEQYYRVE